MLGGMEFSNHFYALSLNGIDNVKASVACGTLRGIDSKFPYSYPCYRSLSFWRFTKWLNRFNRELMISREKVNILFGCMLHGGGFWGLELKHKHGFPLIAQSHGSDVQLVPEIRYGAIFNSTEEKKIKKVLAESDHLVALSTINRKNMIDFGAVPEKISIIHNGIQWDEIQKVPYENMRSKLGLSDDDFVLITVGRNRPVKRMDLLFKAISLIKEKKNIKCICVGPENDLFQSAFSSGCSNNVILAGRIPKKFDLDMFPPFNELINLYRSADLYVSTSYVESFGLAAADALACGIPILVGQRHGVRDIITEGQTGFVMQKETPQELADMIVELSRFRNKFKQDSSQIMESVKGLTWDNQTKKLVSICQVLL